MARKSRIQAEGLIYHVLSRGNNKQLIFKERSDYIYFLNALLARKEKYNYRLLCYALLPNHFHLLVQTTETARLSTIMQSLLTCYSLYFNKKYNRVGHLFQNRYKSLVCLRDPYLISLISYIHENPKRAGLADDSLKYEFTSLPIYVFKKKSRLVDISFISQFLTETFGRQGTHVMQKLS